MFNNDFAAGASNALAAIFSLAGPVLTERERSFFQASRPFGFILFARNCETPDQLRALTQQLKETIGRDCPILIDQEGGRVQRLRPPLWRQYPPMRSFGEKAEEGGIESALEDLRFTILQLAEELRDGGINVDCAPVLDVLMPGTHDVIGDRAFSEDPAIVGRLGLSVCRTLLAAGITPVIKHLPGHGRAQADSHKTLPVVEASAKELKEVDFRPFQDIVRSDIASFVWAMPTPVLYKSLDPDHAACASEKVISAIRDTIGFKGFLVSDALDMEGFAAYGDAAQRVQAVLKAGCDAALYCPGILEDMEKIAESVPNLSPKALKSLQNTAGFPKLSA